MTQAASPELETIVSTIDGLKQIPLEHAADNLRFAFEAKPGLYQFSVLIDARDFDWEQLYEILNKYHNVNQRTGPWDFSINYGAIPLVPAYWVSVNGRRLGLWFFERVSLEDIEHKRFRGKFAFYAEGLTAVELQPFSTEPQVAPSLEDERHSAIHQATVEAPSAPPTYDRSGLRWVSATLEADPEDCLQSIAGVKDATHAPAARWLDPAYWQDLRAKLQTTHALYQQPLQRTFDWLMAREDHGAEDLVLLIAAHHVANREGAVEKALATVDRLVAMRYWGNPNPAGYSHNGDMNAMQCLRGLTWAYYGLRDELGDDRRARLLEKLRHQGRIFFDLVLLNRDYWGGSVVQDHGWKSLFGFGVVALHLLGIVPEAQQWVAYCLPRLRRSLAAMPLDGVVPPSSHQHLYLYLDDLSQYRDALLAQTGEDIYDQPQFRSIVDYCIATLHLPTHALLTTGADSIRLCGGAQFLNQIAAKFADRRAAWLQEQMQQAPERQFYHGTQMYGYYQGAVMGLLSYQALPGKGRAPAGPAADSEFGQTPMLTHFPDSGLIHYRDEERGVALSARCGPLSGYNSYRGSLGSCDRLDTVPAAGHFSFYVDGVPLLCSPDGGYKLHSGLRSALLVDGQGQYGDIGYPMSIPSKLHRGEQVQIVRWDGETQEGLVRLFITPAYPEALGLAHYTRDFLLVPGRIVVRDTVVLDEPRQLAWLFQGMQSRGVRLDGLRAELGQDQRLWIEPETGEATLRASVQPTEVVYSYASGNNFAAFDHVRYETTGKLRRATVDFALTWQCSDNAEE